MRQRRRRHSQKQNMPIKLKILLIRTAAAAIIFSAAFGAKQFVPEWSFFVKNQISYNTNLENVGQTAKAVILKYSPISSRQAEN